MIREEEFILSHRPYAVDLESLRVSPPEPDRTYVWARVNAVWFRRRKGLTVACAGELRDLQDPEPDDVLAFLAAHDDGRYGGDCRARWDGTRLWTVPDEADPDSYKRYLELLGPMLMTYPACPPGFDGWWTFHGQA